MGEELLSQVTCHKSIAQNAESRTEFQPSTAANSDRVWKSWAARGSTWRQEFKQERKRMNTGRQGTPMLADPCLPRGNGTRAKARLYIPRGITTLSFYEKCPHKWHTNRSPEYSILQWAVKYLFAFIHTSTEGFLKPTLATIDFVQVPQELPRWMTAWSSGPN